MIVYYPIITYRSIYKISFYFIYFILLQICFNIVSIINNFFN